MKKGFIGMREIAKEAGVSVAAVSLAFSGSNRVSEKTKKRIFEIAKKYNYHVNVLARNLSKGKSNVLSIILPQIAHIFADPFFSEALSGCYDSANEHGFKLILSIASKDFCAKKEYLRQLFSKEVSGSLYIGSTLNDRYLSDFLATKFPFMLVGSYFDDLSIPFIIADNELGGSEIAKHIIYKHKARRIVCIFGNFVVVSQRDRFYGLRKIIRESGISFSQDRYLFFTDFTSYGGYSAVDEVLKLKPDAIVCGNDIIAYGVIDRLLEKNIKPGKDIIVTGFDDIKVPLINKSEITTVSYPVYEMGYKAVKRIIESIESGKQLSVKEVLPVELKIRKSCGC